MNGSNSALAKLRVCGDDEYIREVKDLSPSGKPDVLVEARRSIGGDVICVQNAPLRTRVVAFVGRKSQVDFWRIEGGYPCTLKILRVTGSGEYDKDFFVVESMASDERFAPVLLAPGKYRVFYHYLSDNYEHCLLCDDVLVGEGPATCYLRPWDKQFLDCATIRPMNADNSRGADDGVCSALHASVSRFGRPEPAGGFVTLRRSSGSSVWFSSDCQLYLHLTNVDRDSDGAPIVAFDGFSRSVASLDTASVEGSGVVLIQIPK